MVLNSSTLSQSSYRGTPYADQSWEIVGERDESSEQFVPMAVEVVGNAETVVDPMFADYGGVSKSRETKRWHLPEHLAVDAQAKKKAAAAVQEKRQSLTEAEIQAIRKEAFEEGRKQGAADSVESSTQRLNTLEQRMGDIFKDIGKQLSEQTARMEQQAVGLSVDIAKKIIDGAVEINPEYIVKIIREALALAGGATIRKIRVSRQDMEFIDVVGIAKHLKEYDGSWSFEIDDTVRAGCIIDTSAGQIDFQLDNAFERVRNHILKVVK